MHLSLHSDMPVNNNVQAYASALWTGTVGDTIHGKLRDGKRTAAHSLSIDTSPVYETVLGKQLIIPGGSAYLSGITERPDRNIEKVTAGVIRCLQITLSDMLRTKNAPDKVRRLHAHKFGQEDGYEDERLGHANITWNDQAGRQSKITEVDVRFRANELPLIVEVSGCDEAELQDLMKKTDQLILEARRIYEALRRKE